MKTVIVNVTVTDDESGLVWTSAKKCDYDSKGKISDYNPVPRFALEAYNEIVGKIEEDEFSISEAIRRRS